MDKMVRNLGITGGVLTFVLSALFFASSIRQLNTGLEAAGISATGILLPGIIADIAGLLGLIGAIIARKNLTTAGFMMIAAVVLCIVTMIIAFSIFYIVSIILFGLGAFIAVLTTRFPESKLYAKLTSPIKEKPQLPRQLKL